MACVHPRIPRIDIASLSQMPVEILAISPKENYMLEIRVTKNDVVEAWWPPGFTHLLIEQSGFKPWLGH